MKVTSAIASVKEGYPTLELVIDGHPATVFLPKLTMLEKGVVVLLDREGYWGDATAADYVEDEGAAAVRIPGATDDDGVVRLVRRLVAGERGDLLAA